MVWLAIAAGGALGSVARHGVNVLVHGRWPLVRFPLATLIVNVLGCFLMALIVHVASTAANVSPTLRLALTTGFLGGLTTYSSFNYETTALFASGARTAALVYLGVTLFGCIAAGLAGLALGRVLSGG